MFRDEEYQDLIDTLHLKGYNEDQIIKLINMKKSMKPSMDKALERMTVRKVIYINQKNIDIYRNAKEEDIKTALNEAGMDTRFPYFLDFGKMNAQGVQKLSWFVWGQERLDPEWLAARDKRGRKLASEAAQMYGIRDQSLANELDKLGRG